MHSHRNVCLMSTAITAWPAGWEALKLAEMPGICGPGEPPFCDIVANADAEKRQCALRQRNPHQRENEIEADFAEIVAHRRRRPFFKSEIKGDRTPKHECQSNQSSFIVCNQVVGGKESELPENEGNDDKEQMQSGAENVHLSLFWISTLLLQSPQQKQQKTFMPI